MARALHVSRQAVAATKGRAEDVGVNGIAPSHEITVDHPAIPLLSALLFVEVATEVHEQSGTHPHAKGGCLAIVQQMGPGQGHGSGGGSGGLE